MKQKLILFIFSVFILSSCTKVEDRLIPLDVACEGCQSIIEDSVLSLDGIYYAKLDVRNSTLMIKVSPEEWDRTHVSQFLRTSGFINTKQDSLFTLPYCCKTQE